jgi:hypothetical protein
VWKSFPHRGVGCGKVLLAEWVLENTQVSDPQAKLNGAWEIAFDVLRGATDSKNTSGYAYMADKAYFEGYLEAKKMWRESEMTWLQAGVLSRSEIEDFRILAGKDYEPEVPYQIDTALEIEYERLFF